MEEKNQKPSAEESKEPQNIENTDPGTTPPPQDTATPSEEVPVKEDESKADAAASTEEHVEEAPSSSEEPAAQEKQKEAIPTENKESEPETEQENEVAYEELPIEKLIEAYRDLTTNDHWLKNHAQIQNINRLFESKFHEDVEAKKKAFIEEGGNEIDFFYNPEYKKVFDQLGYEYRKQRRSHYKEQEVAQKVNLDRKKAIIEEIKGLIGADDNINTIYKNFRTLQESWYNTGPVSRSENQNLWETFKHHVERFYDFLHLNRELRELDFKHNYEEKLKIIERAEALQELPDVIRASRDLNTLHKLWKNDLGPVAKEHREALWKRFQDATKIIQDRRQEYQKDVAGAMKENLEKKKALLKEMQGLTENEPSNHSGWQNALKKFNTLRENFKTIGYVPSKESKDTWQEFREIGRDFMHKKNIFYKNQKKEFNQNIEGKKELILRSQKIVEDPAWDSKVQEMKTLQKEWRAIGFVPRKLDNKLWSEFSVVHKTFFDRIKSGYQHLNEEQEALKKEKQEQIDKISAIAFSEDPEQLLTELAALWEQWNSMEKVGGQTEMEMNKQFTSTLSKAISKLKLDKNTLKEVQLKLDTQLLQNDPNKLQKELNEVKATLDELNNERTQLENNLEFFSDSSAENPLYKNVEKQINSCQKKIDKAKEEYIRLKQIRNAQTKLANQENEHGNESSEEDQESTTE